MVGFAVGTVWFTEEATTHLTLVVLNGTFVPLVDDGLFDLTLRENYEIREISGWMPSWHWWNMQGLRRVIGSLNHHRIAPKDVFNKCSNLTDRAS